MANIESPATEPPIYLRVVGEQQQITKEKALSLWQVKSIFEISNCFTCIFFKEGKVTGLFKIPNQEVFEACRDFCVQGIRCNFLTFLNFSGHLETQDTALKEKFLELSELMTNLKAQVTELTNENKAHQTQIQYWTAKHNQITEVLFLNLFPYFLLIFDRRKSNKLVSPNIKFKTKRQ